jgi:hypothetical protein
MTTNPHIDNLADQVLEYVRKSKEYEDLIATARSSHKPDNEGEYGEDYWFEVQEGVAALVANVICDGRRLTPLN